MRDLAAVQRRREWPPRIVQAAQAAGQRIPSPPPLLYMLPRVPVPRDLPARLVGFGVGRPRVESPDLAANPRH